MNLSKKLLILSLICVSASLSTFAEKIVLTGSDIIKPVIQSQLVDTAKSENIDLQINMDGTFAALDSLKSGKSNIAILALPKNITLPDGVVAMPFAFQSAVIAVNSENPIEEISTDQLQQIFSYNTTIRADSWGKINSASSMAQKNIIPNTTAFDEGVVLELFKNLALNGSDIAHWVTVYDNNNDQLATIKANNAVVSVFAKVDPNNKSIKTLSVSKSDSDSNINYAFKPDQNNMLNGDYPLTLPFFLVVNKNSINSLKPLIKILLSDVIANQIDMSNFYSAPQNSRKKSIFDVDISK